MFKVLRKSFTSQRNAESIFGIEIVLHLNFTDGINKKRQPCCKTLQIQKSRFSARSLTFLFPIQSQWDVAQEKSLLK